MPPRLVVLGWDSATFDVAEPLIDAGRLPALAALADRGQRAPLRSTWPPMTDCAWTSAFPGRNPGAHGIFGSWYRAPGAYAPRLFTSRDRRAPALWELTRGVRWLVWNVPMTYPPTPVEGAMVAGYGSPPGARFCHPEELGTELAARWPLDDLLDRAPHATLERFLADLERGLERQAEALTWAASHTGADAVIAVWPHIDRAQHFLWRFRGTSHPLARGVDAVYEAMDRATAAVIEAWPDADILVVSDHGAGPLKGDVNLGAWLVSRNRAAYRSSRPSPLLAAAWALPPAARRAARRIAPGLARRAFGATLAGQLGPFEWSRTAAFAGLHGDLWINLKEREQQGTVDAREFAALRSELAEELRILEDPRSGERVFAAVMKGEEIYSGAEAGIAPDLMLDSWSAGYRVAPGRGPSEVVVDPAPLAGVDEPWSSDHRPLGIFVAAGPRMGTGTHVELDLYDVCPTALTLLEQHVPDDLDGEVARAVLDPDWLERHPVVEVPAAAGRAGGGDYSEEEAAAVAAHLKDLGYIE
jgi:predicted AlkP superfamily phosphohydrolase/phosphomutase